MFFIACIGRVEFNTVYRFARLVDVQNFPLMSQQLADSAPWCYATRLANTPGTKSNKQSGKK
jgi:hypothetical protein